MAKRSKIKIDGRTITRVQRKVNLTDEKRKLLTKKRERLYSQKSYWVKKWNEATTKKAANEAFKEAQYRQRQLNLVNQQLGVTYDLPEVKKEARFEGAVRIKQYNVWEGIKRIREIIKKRFYTIIVMNGQSYNIKTPSKVYAAYDDLEHEAYAIPRGTPMVEFAFDIKNKKVSISIF